MQSMDSRSQQQLDSNEPSDDDDDEANASKENDPSLSPSPVSPALPSPRKNILGKRPLSALPTPIDPDIDEDDTTGPSPSERNIAINSPYFPADEQPCAGTLTSRPRKSPKLAERSREVNASSRSKDEQDAIESVITPFEDDDAADDDSTTTRKEFVHGALDEGKENVTEGAHARREKSTIVKMGVSSALPGIPAPAAARKVSTASTASNGSGKGIKPRVGLRRL